MPVLRAELIDYLDTLLNAKQIKDYCPNGLQVEGKQEIQKIVTGVTASEALIDAAIEQGADAILVHHGYFWKGEAYPIVGMKKNRIGKLIQNEISLIAYHLPIDVHSELGNNAQIGKLLALSNVRPALEFAPEGIIMLGEYDEPKSIDDVANDIDVALNREPLVSDARQQKVKSLAWCTGGGQSYIDQVAELGVDLFITGEASEQTIHSSRELDIDFIAAGHHATERYGVKMVGEHLAEKFGLNVQFVDIHNPV